MKDIRFVTSERYGLTQYVYLGYVKRLSNRTITGKQAVSADNPMSLNTINLDSLNKQSGSVPVRDIVLVNVQQSYPMEDIMNFANHFNQQGYGKRITKVLDEQGLAVEKATLLN